MTALFFFGSDQYSAIVLSHLIEAQRSLSAYALALVITDKQPTPNPVEKLAYAHNIKISYYPSIDYSLITKDTLGLCASFDHLLPVEIIKNFSGHLYNLHPSLLPQYRNVSPVQYAIALGDKETGITLFRISAGIDNGEIIAQVSDNILSTDTTPSLTSKLFAKGAQLFLNSDLNSRPAKLDFTGTPLIFTRRLTKDSGFIEWSVLQKLLTNQPILLNESQNVLLNLRLQKELATNSNIESRSYLLDLLRALTPWPGVWSLVPTKKGELRITVESVIPEIKIKLAGKPNAISYLDFAKYYL